MINLTPSLKKQLKNLPTKTGCYLFYNSNNQLIYVGKSKNIFKRVNSYFNRASNFKTTKLVSEIFSIDYILTSNEKEALLLEHNLIKNQNPRYNILLTDDKTYPYIVITTEKDPQYRYVRRIENLKAKSYGPFPDGTGAREILKILQHLFPLRRCAGNLNKPCLYYHLKLCSGACFKEVPSEYYILMKKRIKSFFKGQVKNIIIQLKRKMTLAANNQQFEQAQHFKNILEKLSFFLEHQRVQFLDYKNRDFVGYLIKDNKLVIVTLFYRQGQLLFIDQQIFPLFIIDDVPDAIRNYLQQLYLKNTLPDTLYIENVDLKDLAQLLELDIVTNIPKNMQEHMKLAYKNAEELFNQYLLNQNQTTYRSLEVIEQLANQLHIKTPITIEVLDIANISNEHIIGGVIVYKNGQPIKKLYRRYKIIPEKSGDYYYLQNLIYRRYSKKYNENLSLPDLIIVDGGKLQMDAVNKQLQLLDLSIPVVGLVKNVHHKTDYLLNMQGYKVPLLRNSLLFHFLMKLQEEVHYYTISFHRKLRTNSLLNNSLQEVKGLGKITIKKLYLHFVTLSSMKTASFEELNAIIKNKVVTKRLQEHLEKL